MGRKTMTTYCTRLASRSRELAALRGQSATVPSPTPACTLIIGHRLTALRSTLLLFAASVVFALFGAGNAHGQVPTKVARETVEMLVRKFGKEVVEEGPEILARQIDTVVARLGDDGLAAIQKVGPRAIRWLDEAGEAAPQVARWVSKHGDEAAWVVANPSRLAVAKRLGDDAVEAMIKLGEPAETILSVGGAAAGQAAVKLAPRQGRQLAMLASDAADSALVKNEALMATVGKYGDRAMDFVWKNKGALAVGTTLAVFLADPEPFLDGTRSLAEIAASTAVAPIARGIATGTNWTLIGLAVLGIGTLFYLLRRRRLHRPRVA